MPISKQNRKAREESRKRTDAKIEEYERTGGFIYWRDQPNILHVPYGWLTTWQLKLGRLTFREDTDTITDQKWWVRQDPRSNEVHSRKQQTSFLDSQGNKVYVHEDRYTEHQYDLMRVSIWYMMEQGWRPKEVYQLLIHPSIDFPQLPGQTPLTPRKIHQWKMIYRAHLSRGFLWP